MNLLEFYKNINGNYDDIMSRIPSEELIIKFLNKFLSDETFNNLSENIKNKDYKNAFMSVHTLKGICLNMSFDDLLIEVILLTEELRNQEKTVDEEKVINLFNIIRNKYNIIINNINKL